MKLRISIIAILICTCFSWGAHKKILITDCTATNCPYCGSNNDEFNEWIEEHSNDVIGMAAHGMGSKLTFPAATKLLGAFGESYFPNALEDYIASYHPGSINSKIGDLGEYTEVSISISHTWNESTQKVSGTIDLEWDEDTDYSRDLVVEIILLQDSISTDLYSQSTAYSDPEPKYHRDLIIDAVNGGIGSTYSSLSKSPKNGDKVSIPFTIDVESTYTPSTTSTSFTADFTKMSLVAYVGLEAEESSGSVSEGNTGEVFNAEKVSLIPENVSTGPLLESAGLNLTDEDGKTISNLTPFQSGKIVVKYTNTGGEAASNITLDIPNIDGLELSNIPTNISDLAPGETATHNISYTTSEDLEAGFLDIEANVSADDDIEVNQSTSVTANAYIWNTSTTLETCNALILDAGGLENYLDDQELTLSLTATTNTSKLVMEVIEFETEEDYDFLYIDTDANGSFADNEKFDGTTISQFPIKDVIGSTIEMKFTSDEYENESGFALKVTCVEGPTTAINHNYNATENTWITLSSSKDQLKINSNFSGKANIFSVLGNKSVSSFSINNNKTLNTSSLQAGVYVIRLENGKSFKFIKTNN